MPMSRYSSGQLTDASTNKTEDSILRETAGNGFRLPNNSLRRERSNEHTF